MATSKTGKRKRHVLDTAWVQSQIVSQIPDAVAEVLSSTLQNALKAVKAASEDVPSLAASSLEVDQVCEIFDLKMDDEPTRLIMPVENYEVPAALVDQIDRFRSKVGKRQPLKEALQRVYVDLLLFNCLLDEDIALQDPRASINEVHSTTTPVRSQRTGITASDFAPGPVPAPMGLYFETELRAPISFKGEKRMLCGFADWSLGHFSGGSGSGNLVLVEAKKRDYIRESYGQLAAYMAICHAARKKEERNNAVVYGIATDGVDYRFWRISNEATLTRSRIYDWNDLVDRSAIYSITRSVIRAAVLSSPTTSPVKSSDLRIFFHANESAKFDYGAIEKWPFFHTSEDDPDVELVELPWAPGTLGAPTRIEELNRPSH